MEKTKKKKNQDGQTEQTKSPEFIGIKSGDKELSSEDLACRELWEGSVQELQAMHFATEEVAVHAVIDKVVAKLGIDEKQDPKVRGFLYDLLTLDPEIMEELRSSLVNVHGIK
ncbi:hypothetical protein OAO01_03380 [Oligoflexia bacterium]|nr:hypothetical protein [Oligoflexia bacterium]